VPQKPKIPAVQPRKPAPEATKKRRPGSILAAGKAAPPLQVAQPRKRRGTGDLLGGLTGKKRGG